MRLFFTLLVFAAITLAAGFLPRPLVKPDWRTPYEEALARGDCEAANRILKILRVTGFWQEAAAAKFQNRRLNRCNAELVADYNRDRQSIFNVDSNGYVDRGYIEARWRSSFLGSRLSIRRGRTKLQMSEIVSAAYNDTRNIVRQCADQSSPTSGGLSNYHLLSYGLKSPGLSVETISKIAREQKAQCVRSLLAALAVMKVAARTPEDRAVITLYSFVASFYIQAAPDAERLAADIFADLSIDDYKLARPGILFSEEPDPLEFVYDCRDDRRADQLLTSAIRCADEAHMFMREFTKAEAPLAAEYAAFYAQRAKRLGWRDVGAAQDAAKARLSEECYNAIVALEAEEAGEKTDVRDFSDLDWPTGAGEACELATPSGP